MRLLVCILICLMFIGCSGETKPAPKLNIDVSQLNSDAAKIIQSKYENATTSTDWKELGMCFQAHGLEDAAIRSYVHSLNLKSDDKAQYLLSITQARIGNYSIAFNLISNVSGYAPAQWQQGFWQLDLGNPAVALEHFENALQLDPTSAAAIIGLARANLALDNPQKTITLLQSLINQGRKHQYVTHLLGKAHQRVGNTEIALQLLKVSKSGHPKWNDPWQDKMRSYQIGFSADLYRAVTKIDANELQEALQLLKAIDKKYEYDPVVQNNLATVYMQLNKQDEAIQVLGKAIRISPKYAPLRLTMAFVMADVGELDKAIAFAKEALNLQPSMYAGASFIAKLAYQKQDFQMAYKYYATSIELGDSNLRTREMLAEVLLRFKQWKKAIWQYNVVLALSPQRTGSIGGLAVALANDGQVDKSKQLLLDALKIYPSDPNLLSASSAIQSIGTAP